MLGRYSSVGGFTGGGGRFHENLVVSPSCLLRASCRMSRRRLNRKLAPPTTMNATPKKSFLPPSQLAVLTMTYFLPPKP